ncbi:MAG: lipopolysaccharide biosynthesis, partial [Oscillospiraceae bacterium]|nr:lipopolysaccharide biosynthesis [Oscillospiraceae bacterium]
MKKKLNKKSAALRNNLILDKVPFHVLESYKAIRTNLMFTCNQEKCPTIIFSSAMPDEGKTTT